MGGPADISHSNDTTSMAPYDATRKHHSPAVDVYKRVNRSTAATASAGVVDKTEEYTNGNARMGKSVASNESRPVASTKECEVSGKHQQPTQHHPTSKWTWAGCLFLLTVSKYTLPSDLRPSSPTLEHVWYYGWVTALSTGLGAAPLFFAHDLGKKMLSVGNAIAAGMMLSASYSLVQEGAGVQEPKGMGSAWIAAGVLATPGARVALGALTGLFFILSTKKVLDKYEDFKFGELHGMDAKKVLLIVFVMTLHSFSEGVGIGVSFGGAGGARLGFIISATLAVHNVPEGLAVALVLHPRGVSKLNTALWCVFTSLPQPLMAVPAFLFVGQFLPFLPVGLGFAAGAMFWVACFELFPEAVEDSSKVAASLTTAASFVTMLCVHRYLDEGL